MEKNMNKNFFEGTRFCRFESVGKICEDADEWFTSQMLHQNIETEETITSVNESKRWDPPPKNRVNCNTKGSWSQKKMVRGCACVVSRTGHEHKRVKHRLTVLYRFMYFSDRFKGLSLVCLVIN